MRISYHIGILVNLAGVRENGIVILFFTHDFLIGVRLDGDSDISVVSGKTDHTFERND